MRQTLLLIFLSTLPLACGVRSSEIKEPVGANNLAYQWGKISLECTANDTETFRPRPTVTSRILGLAWTAAFDAWSRYDEHATPMYLAGVDRRPTEEQTTDNKERAI